MADKELSHWACRLEFKIAHMPFYQPHIEYYDCLEKTVEPNYSHFQAQHWNSPNLRIKFYRGVETSGCYVAELDEKVVGMVAYEKKVYLIQNTYD